MDETYIRQCLELAAMGTWKTRPNPLVGSVIVHEGKIIGEGYHREFGRAHAEVNAINSVEDHSLLKESTLYVNLEPCSHFGQTPPCSNLILEKGIPKVVIGASDPNSVSGGGASILRKKGVEVKIGVMENECLNLNKRFYTFHRQKRPWILLKWAQSADGFLDIERTPGEPVGINWITGRKARSMVHKWRSEEMAILVGTRTAEMDDPELTVREWTGPNPLRLVIDRKGKLDRNLRLFNGEADTVVFTEKAGKPGKSEKPGKSGPPRDPGKRLRYVEVPEEGDYIREILDYLYGNNITSLMVEGGAQLLNEFLARGLWDEARVFTGKRRFEAGTRAPVLPVAPAHSRTVEKDLLEVYCRPED